MKAREFDAKDVSPSETEDASNAVDDDMIATLEDSPRDPVEDELVGFIDGLNIDAQVELVALAWLGRDDYSRDDWQELVRQASQAHTTHTGRYLIEIPLLADYLEQGLELLGFSCADVEADRL